MELVTCSRCHQQRPAAEKIPYTGDLLEQIRRNVCSVCWAEWLQAEVIVINELRLDFMDPRSNDILVQHLREFLGLADDPPSAS